MKIEINDKEFNLHGLSTFDGNLHLHFRPLKDGKGADSFTWDDIKEAITAGDKPVTIYKDEKIAYVFEGFTQILSVTMEYAYKYNPAEEGTAIMVVLKEPILKPDDLNDIKMALVELASLIG